jgi:hypothetical protein
MLINISGVSINFEKGGPPERDAHPSKIAKREGI